MVYLSGFLGQNRHKIRTFGALWVICGKYFSHLKFCKVLKLGNEQVGTQPAVRDGGTRANLVYDRGGRVLGLIFDVKNPKKERFFAQEQAHRWLVSASFLRAEYLRRNLPGKSDRRVGPYMNAQALM